MKNISDEDLYMVITHEVAHYITYLCCNIVPEQIDFEEGPNGGVIGRTLLSSANKEIRNIVDYFTRDCISSMAGPLSAYLDFKSKTIINRKEAIDYFNQSLCCKKDREIVGRELTSLYTQMAKDKSPIEIEKNVNDTILDLCEDTFEYLEENSPEIEALTNYIFCEMKKGKVVFSTKEISGLSFIHSQFGDLVPGYYLNSPLLGVQ